ncbi:hypothetical protein [Trinickia terrae]|uniref:hypothetical protein n=1 Tax=Trinickia terrae TaxID=2571161 RepID=UPI00197F6592|nr:hypothetical protein [Trinickia terrae]
MRHLPSFLQAIRPRIAASWLAALTLVLAGRAYAAEQVISVPLAGGATISYLLTQPDAGAPQWVLVMFPGGEGALQLSQSADGTIRLLEHGNFLVRSRTLFATDGFATAVIDAPSDQSGGYSDEFRASPRHAQDLERIAADLRQRFPSAKLVLIGTSRGTISSAFAGRALPGVWDAVIHTSTLSSPSRGQALPLTGFDYGSIQARQLFVHHEDDACFLCSYRAAREIAAAHDLITVHGGMARGNPCQAKAHHGFYGEDQAVVAAIKAWIVGGAWPKDVDGD